MRIRAYLRVAQDEGARKPYKIEVDSAPNHQPLFKQGYRSKTFLPTVSFAVDLNLPDDAFTRAANVIASITVPEEQVDIAIETRPTDTIN